VFEDGHYLTNPDVIESFPTPRVVPPNRFGGFYEVWRTHATHHNAVPPVTMRQATREAHERHERVVAHWLQPHEPFIASDAPIVGGAATKSNVWDALQRGEVGAGVVWDSYKATLELALEHVDALLEEVDARVLVTADHGNAFGEWGIYGHPWGWPQPAVRRVPWVLVDATKERETPSTSVLSESGSSVDVDEQLRALGYR